MTRILRRLAIGLIGFALFALLWISLLAILSAVTGIPLDLVKVSFLAAGILVAFIVGFLVCEWTKRSARKIGPGFENPLEGT